MQHSVFLSCQFTIIYNVSVFFQVFDTNSNSEKLFRFRLGKGKVIKVRDSFTWSSSYIYSFLVTAVAAVPMWGAVV